MKHSVASVLFLWLIVGATAIDVIPYDCTPALVVNGNVIAPATNTICLDIRCSVGETLYLTGQTSYHAERDVYISCNNATRVITSVVQGYVPKSTTLWHVSSVQSIGLKANTNTSSIPDDISSYMTQRDAPAKQTMHRHRRAGGLGAQIALGFGLAGITGGAAAAGFFCPTCGIAALGAGLSGVFGGFLSDYTGVSQAQINQLGLNQTSVTGALACTSVLQGGVGINGLAGCLYTVFDMINGIWSEINLIESAVSGLQSQVTSVKQLMNILQGNILTLQDGFNQLTQKLESALKVMSNMNEMINNVNALTAQNTYALSAASTTTNQNNQNLENAVTVVAQTFQSQFTVLANAQVNLAAQAKAEITLESRRILQYVSTTFATFQLNMKNLVDSIVIRNDMTATQLDSSIAQIFNALNTMNGNNNAFAQQLADLYRTVADLAQEFSTPGPVVVDVYRALAAAIDMKQEVPVISGWGRPPLDPDQLSLLQHREIQITMPRICNNGTQSCRTSVTAFGAGQPWKADVIARMESTIPLTVQLNSIYDANVPQCGDEIVLVAWVDSGLQYVSANCDIDEPHAYALCVNSNPSTALTMRLQCYEHYLATHYNVTNDYAQLPTTINACTSTPLGSNITFFSCNMTNNLTLTQFVCNVTTQGSLCTSQFLSSSVNITSNITQGGCTILNYTCGESLYSPTTYSVINPQLFPATNIYPNDQIYFGAANDQIGKLVKSHLQTSSSSDYFYLTQPPSDLIDLNYVFTVNAVNVTGMAIYAAIDNTNVIQLISSTGYPLSLNNGGFLVSNAFNATAGLLFQIIPINVNSNFKNDTGLPIIARRSVEDDAYYYYEDVMPIEAPGMNRRRSTPESQCAQLNLFNTVSASNQPDPALTAQCLQVPGCIVVRIPRTNQAQISVDQVHWSTINYGASFATMACSDSNTCTWSIQNIAIMRSNGATFTPPYIKVTTGNRLRLVQTYPATGCTSTIIWTSDIVDVSVIYGFDINAMATSGPCGATYDLLTSVLLFLEEDPVISGSIIGYDVCVDNQQPNNVVLSNTACSILSTQQITLSVPQTLGKYYHASPPSTDPGIYEFLTANLGSHSYAGATSVVAMSLTTLTDPWTYYTYLTSPYLCYARCSDIGRDRDTCIRIASSYCSWAYDPASNSNTCTDLNYALTPSATNSTFVPNSLYVQGIFYVTTSPSTPYTVLAANGTNIFHVLNVDPVFTVTACNGNPSFLSQIQVNGAFDPKSDTDVMTLAINLIGYGIPNPSPFGSAYLLNNASCLGTDWQSQVTSLTITLMEVDYSPSNHTYAMLYIPGNIVGVQNVNNCNTTNLANFLQSQYAGLTNTTFSTLPDQILCQATRQLAYGNSSGYSYQNFPLDYSSLRNVVNNFTGAWLGVPWPGTAPICVWDTVAGQCQNYDGLYKNPLTQLVPCNTRLADADELGRCIQNPGGFFLINSVSYQERCAYILDGPTGKCVPYAYDNTYFPGAIAMGPYNLPVKQSSSLTIVQDCLTPNVQCYFESSPARGSGSGYGGTTDWYAHLPAGAQSGLTCGQFFGDQNGCVIKTSIGGIPQCQYEFGGICTPLCPTFNGNPAGCVARQPYDTCYYEKDTATCSAIVSYQSLGQCQNFNCFSASTICYMYSADSVGCAASGTCTWVNVLNPNGTVNAAESVCTAFSQLVDPNCFDVNGNPLASCNSTYLQGIDSSVIQIIGTCNVNQTLSQQDFTQACVTSIDSHSGLNCVYLALGTGFQSCYAPNDPRMQQQISTAGNILKVKQVTLDQYRQSLNPSARTYSGTFNEIKVNFRDSASAITIANMASILTVSGGSAASIFACTNTSYKVVGIWCCLSSEIDSTSGQCGHTHYLNPYHPTRFMQDSFLAFAEADAASIPHSGDYVVSQSLNVPHYEAGISEPTPSSPYYGLNELGCPILTNATDFPLQVGNYSLNVYIPGQAYTDLALNLLAGSLGCSVPYEVSGSSTMLSRLGVLTWTAAANALQVQLYDQTAYNVSFWTDITGNIKGVARPDFTLYNVTNDMFSDLFSLYSNDIETIKAVNTAKFGNYLPLWNSLLPDGILIEDVYKANTIDQFGYKAKDAYFISQTPETLPVNTVLNTVDSVNVTVTVVDTTNLTPTQYYTLTTASQVSYNNLNLLPQIGQSWTFKDDGYMNPNATMPQIFSPPYSSCTPCAANDWCVASSNNPGVQHSNLSDYTSACGQWIPTNMRFPVSAYACPRNPNTPFGTVDYRGVVVGSAYIHEQSLRQALGMDILLNAQVIDSNNRSLFYYWNNTITVYGETYILNWIDQVQDEALRLGCTVIPFRNFIDPASLYYCTSSNTTVCGMDFFRPMFETYENLINVHFESNNTALAAIVDEFLVPFAGAKNNPYCGNCGSAYGTNCLYPYAYVATAAIQDCHSGLNAAFQDFYIQKLSDQLLRFDSRPGTAVISGTMQIQDVVSVQPVIAPGECPLPIDNNTPVISCDTTQVNAVCIFNVLNPSSIANLQLSFGISSDQPSCAQNQVRTIAPLQMSGTRLPICAGTNDRAFISLLDGTNCFNQDFAYNVTGLAYSQVAEITVLSQQNNAIIPALVALQNALGTTYIDPNDPLAYKHLNLSMISSTLAFSFEALANINNQLGYFGTTSSVPYSNAFGNETVVQVTVNLATNLNQTAAAVASIDSRSHQQDTNINGLQGQLDTLKNQVNGDFLSAVNITDLISAAFNNASYATAVVISQFGKDRKATDTTMTSLLTIFIVLVSLALFFGVFGSVGAVVFFVMLAKAQHSLHAQHILETTQQLKHNLESTGTVGLVPPPQGPSPSQGPSLSSIAPAVINALPPTYAQAVNAGMKILQAHPPLSH